MTDPLVTVICLCYNHERFVKEAIDSVLIQTYASVEIIVVDDASTDQSVAIIQDIVGRNPQIRFIPLEANVGNCKAFNTALAFAKGSYIVDFATDDIMQPYRLEKQVKQFASLNDQYGVVFSDATYIDETGKFVKEHVSYLKSKRLLSAVPEGDVYVDILQRYFICSPTMMIRKKVFDQLNGYDENLAYEDFDFWVRSSRTFLYSFLDEVLTKVRLISSSLSKRLYATGDQQLYSTYLICEKALRLNRNDAENTALAQRIEYELRQAVFSDNKSEAELFFRLLKRIKNPNLVTRFYMKINSLNLRLSPLRKWYLKLKYP
jgi:glycosyltransferase involved in cell wall biosynthesis